MNSRRTMANAVLMAVLIVATMALKSFSSGPAILEVTGPEPVRVADPLANEVDPFALTLTPSKDTWVNSDSPNTNYGADLELTMSTGGQQAFILLDFDLSALPDDADIISATLSVYPSESVPGDPYAMLPYAITSGWEENVVTWNSRPSSSYRGDPVIMYTPDDWSVFDVTHIVQDWYDGALSINGIAIDPEVPSSGSRTFQARSTAAPPELSVYYTRRAELMAIKDTWVGAAQPSTSHGADPGLSVYSSANPEQEAHALLGFDFDSLPDDIAVISATLSMYSLVNRSASAGRAVQIADLYADAILGDWNESTTTWNNAPASYYLDDPPSEYVVSDFTHWDVTNIVASWADGDFDPYGILLRVGPETALAYSFWSRDTAKPPKLMIEYGAAPPDCNPITSVDVSGATAGVTGVEYTFDAVLFPTDADPPNAIGWQVTDYPRLYGESVTLSWDTPGEKTLAVVVDHCGGTVSTMHYVDISEPPPDCTLPLRGVGMTGPVVIDTGSSHVYRASSLPFNATDPVTFTWQATGQPTSVYTTSLNYWEQPYLWSEAGSKTITVTAENCGGSAAVYYGVEVVDPADLPDLTISTAWNEVDQERIGYVLHNQGDTAVPSGFYVSLEQNSNTPAADVYPYPLEADGIGVGYVDYAWTCPAATATVGVLADWAEEVVELDELNNRWNDSWACDQRPPSILSGPDVSDTTETRARVSWTTDEECAGWVEYGTSPYNQSLTEPGSGAYITSHSVNLTGLIAGTTYYARAFCTDAAGWTVNSEAVPFETEPPGTDPPVIRSVTPQEYPSAFYEFWEVIVELEDGSYMDRVSCSLNGDLLGIDYSADDSGDYPFYSVYLSPYELGMSRSEFFGQSHQISCTAYRQHPTAYTTVDQAWYVSDPGYPIRLQIEEPPSSHKVYVDGSAVPAGVTLDATVYAAAYEWACTWSRFSEGDVVPPGLSAVGCDDLTPMPVDTVELWITGEQKDTVSPGSELVSTLTADIAALPVGTHELQVVASKGASETDESRNLIVEQGEAQLEVERSISREGNTLEITLDLHNVGTATANVVRIVDDVIGVQPILRRDDSGDFTYVLSIIENQTLADGSGARYSLVSIEFDVPQQADISYLDLAPGASVSVSYEVVPILTIPSRPPMIGSYLEVWLYEGSSTLGIESFDLSGTLVDDPTAGAIPLEDAVGNAISQADYVIVTSPSRVYSVLADSNPDRDAELLFSNMAELAALENGVVGFLLYYDTQTLNQRIEPGGSWAEALSPSFSETDNGYVLIVGETEIVPSFYVEDFDVGDNFPNHVRDSDLWYADTSGQTARPELVVGRVVGDELTMMNSYLENIISVAKGESAYSFDWSHALVTNGGGDGWGTFQDDAEEVDYQLDIKYDESLWLDLGDVVSPTQWAYYQTNLPDRDLVLYRGHGNQDAWGSGLFASLLNVDYYGLGSTHPAMFGAACVTGNYENDNDLNLAEILLWKGAGAYVGATEVSARSVNSEAFVNLVPEWQSHESMGQALNQVKRDIWAWEEDWEHDKLWVYEYNLYGDPKYGRKNPQQARSASQPEDETLSVTTTPQGAKLKIGLPELEFSQVDGDDVVRISGGGMLNELGAYPVPVWTLSMDFPAGQQVRDVTLFSRSGLVVTGPLNLPLVTSATDCECADDLSAPAEPAVTGWYPTQDRVLDWSVEKAPNGDRTLYVLLYPFYYHTETGDALYYSTYQLTVETLDSTAQIESLEAPSSGNEPGAPVILELTVSRTGKPADVIVQGSVRTRSTNELLGGLPLVTLHDLTGVAAVDLLWDTRPYAAGDYQVVVELLGTEGHLLDTAVEEVRLGTVGARLTGLTASQKTFSPGDQVTLTMGVQNTGTVPITGTAIFLVQQSEGLTVTQVITAPVEGLAAGKSKKPSVIWDTTGAEEVSYRVLGYVKFYSQTTEPLALTLSRPRVFLPLVIRS
jgi:uncharacterized repeat protein (TIGR01451 family)